MKKKLQSENNKLRSKAEELLSKELKKTIAQLSEAEIYKLLHELEVHQIELQLQNEELIIAKEAAVAATEKYTELYDFAPTAYYTLSRNAEILQTNFLGAKILGEERSKLLNKHFSVFISVDTRSVFLDFLEKIFISKALESCELTLRPDGRNPVFVHLTGQVSADNNQFYITLTDISESKLAHLAILKSDKRYLALIENLEAGVVVHGADTSILMSNDKASELLGLTGDQMRGKTAVDPAWKFVKEDKANLDQGNYPVNRILKTKQPIKDQIFGIVHSGKEPLVWVSVSGFPILNSSGDVTEVVISFIDVTKRHLAELELQKKDALLNITGNTAKVGGWEFDVETKKQTWTDEVYAIHEVDRSFNPNVDKGINFYAPWCQLIIRQAVEEAIEFGKPFDLELELITRKGKHIWVHSIGEAKQENGKTTRVYGSIQDITDRKKADEAIRVNSSRLELAMQAANMAWWEMDIPTGNVIFDKHKTDMIGFAAEDFKHYRDFMALVHPNDSDKALIAMKNHIDGLADKYETSYRILSRSGEYKWFHDIGTIVRRDSNGKPLSVLGLVSDITQRKQNEENLKQSEQRLELLSEQSGVGIALFSKDGKIQYFNQKALANLGGKSEDFFGKTLYEVFGEEAGKKYLDRILKEITQRDHCIYEDYLETPGGNFWFSSVFSVVCNDEGGVIGVQVVSHNTTDQKLAEAALAKSKSELKAIYELSPVMMCLVDENRKVIFANKQFTSLTGTDEEQLKGGHACGVFGCINALDDSRGCGFGNKCKYCNLRLAMEDTLKNGTGHSNVEYHTTLMQNGVSREVVLLGSTAIIESNANRNLLLCLNDITDRKHAEEEIKRTGQHYQALIEKAPDGVALIGKDGYFSFISPSARKMFGYEPDAEPGHPDEYTHPDDLPKILAELYKLLENPAYTPTLQYRFKHQKGYWRWIETTFSNLLAHPSVESIVLNFRDITERKLMEDTQSFLLQISNPGSDENFFESLAKFLAQSLDMEYVCIDILEGDGLTATTLAIYNEGNFETNVSYTLKDTPCGEVVGNHICCYPSEVRRLFPHDPALEDIKAESYIGTTLRNFEGKPIGLIAVIGQKPLENYALAESVLKQISIRAAGKLEATLAEKKLKESEEKFRVLIESTSVAIYLTDLNGKCTYVNPKWCEIAQLSAAEAMGDGWINGIYEEDRDQVFENWQQMVASDGTWSFEYRFGTPEKLSWVFGTAKSYKNDLGQIVGFIGSNVDITERKRAEEEVIQAKLRAEESENYFRNIFENSPIGKSITGLDGSLKTNKAFCDMLGYSFEEFQSKNFRDVSHPDDLQKTLEIIDSLLKGEKIIGKFEKRYIHKNGSIIYAFVVTTLQRNHLGEPMYFITSVNDITERMLSEAVFRDIIEKNPMSIQILDMEGYPIQVNSAHTNLFGIKPPANYSVFKDPQLLAKGFGDYFEQIKTGNIVYLPDAYYNVHDLDPDFPDNPLWVRAIAFALNDIGGKPERIVFMHENITERKHSEDLLTDIIEKNPMSIQITDQEGRTIHVNPAFTKLFGAIPPPDFSIFDDLQTKNKELEKLIAYAKRGEVVHLPDIYFNPHDEVAEAPDNPCWVRAMIFPLKDSGGKPERFVLMHENITESKLAEAELHEREIQYQNLANSGPAMIWTAGTDKLCNYFNDTWLSFTGRSLEQVLGDGWTSDVHPDDLDGCLKTYMNAFDRHENFEMEYRLRHVTGEYRWIMDLGTPNYDSRGEFVGYIGNCFDITERKRIEDELNKNEERLRDIIKSAGDWVWEVDQDGIYTYSSNQSIDLLGRLPDEIIGKSPFDYMPDDEAARIAVLFKDIVEKKLPIIDLENWNITKSGERICLLTNGFPMFDKSGNLIGYRGVDKDITKRKQIEQKLFDSEYEFRSLAESMPQIVWITRPDGWNIFFNQQWVNYTGLTLEESYGHGWNKPFHPDDQQRAWEAWLNATTNLATYSLECRLRRFDGEYKWWLIRGVPVRNEQGDIIKWFGTCTDINDIKLSAKELLEAKEHAEESDRLKSSFLANMSHEIRTPLNSIIGFSDLLSDPDYSEEQKTEFTKTIIDNGNNLSVIINDILDLSMIAAEQIILRVNRFSPKKLMDDLLNELGRKALDKGIDIRLSVPPEFSDLVMESDNYRIRQILANLIGNAIKFTSQGFVEFGYLIRGENIEFHVRDTGIGIAAENFDAIFDRFRQLEITKTRRFGGNGLGLAISKNLAQLLGGRIWVESELGKGSVFYLSLPLNSEKKV